MVSVCTYALLSHYTYIKPDLSDLDTLGYKLPKGWKVLGISSHGYLESLEQDGYFGIAFMKDRNLIFAHRGSVISLEEPHASIHHILNDISLSTTHLKFTQFKYARDFIKKTLSRIDNIDDIRLSFTGHSLGAALGEISAVYYNKKAVLFDNPGAKSVIEKQHYNRYNIEDFDIVSYQGERNIINDCCEKYGEIIRVSNKSYNLGDSPLYLLASVVSDYLSAETHSLSYIMEKLNCDIPDNHNIYYA